ncbi:hypothetical protein C1I93_23685, partial [Micromonospora endophytica]
MVRVDAMTDLRRPGPSRPPVLLRPAPAVDPPFVDEGGVLWPGPSDEQLSLDLFADPSGPLRGEVDRFTVPELEVAL